MDSVHQTFIASLKSWATTQSGIKGILLVGSLARGAGRPESDVDLVIIARDPQVYLSEIEWAGEFGEISGLQTEDWGQLTSVRVWYQHGLEVEFGFTRETWIETPLDPGTRKVLAGGFQILFARSIDFLNLDGLIR